jgi:hypothetical protein
MMDTSSNYQQHNAPGPGGQVIANQGGTQTIIQAELQNYFRSGFDALDGNLYPLAVQKFEAYLSTSREIDPFPPERREQRAEAHFYAALALLGKRAPQHKGMDEIDRIISHLDHAAKQGAGPVRDQARVLAAIVKEDYYEADGMDAPEPKPAELSGGLDALADRAALESWVPHLGPIDPARSRTWWYLAQLAQRNQIPVPELRTGPAHPVVDPGRPEAVRKYFTPTPVEKSRTRPIVMMSAGGFLALLGIVIGSWFPALLFLGGGGWLAYQGVLGYLAYREYVRRFHLAEPKPSHRQMDDWLAQDVRYVLDRAAERLRLDVRQKSALGDLLVPGQVLIGLPDLDRTAGHHVCVREDHQGKLRADTYDVLVVFLATNLVATYQCMLDCYEGNILFDETREYQYQHVVGMSSASIPMPKALAEVVDFVPDFEGKPPLRRNQHSLALVFTLSIMDGEKFPLNTGYVGSARDDRAEVAWGNKHSLAIIQRMVRSRRGGV